MHNGWPNNCFVVIVFEKLKDDGCDLNHGVKISVRKIREFLLAFGQNLALRCCLLEAETIDLRNYVVVVAATFCLDYYC